MVKTDINKVIIGVILLVLVLVVYNMYIIERNSTEENNCFWAMTYVTPDDESVELQNSITLGISYNGFLVESDIRSLQRWVASEITYEMEDPEYPSETIFDKTGSCFNMCNLLLSMLLNENEQSNVGLYMLLVDVKLENSDEIFKHSSVLSVFNDGIIISDPTVGTPSIDSICIKDSPLEALERIVSGTTVDWYIVTDAVCMDNTYTFSNQQEFIAFCENGGS